jgi:hypothetical protein
MQVDGEEVTNTAARGTVMVTVTLMGATTDVATAVTTGAMGGEKCN